MKLRPECLRAKDQCQNILNSALLLLLSRSHDDSELMVQQCQDIVHELREVAGVLEKAQNHLFREVCQLEFPQLEPL